jgi:hypothetical protein
MPIEKKPFENYTLDEDKTDPLEQGKVFTLRLNAKEYSQLKEDMKDLNIKNESTTIKFLAGIGRNVLHGILGKKKIRWIFNKTRAKYDDF